MLNFLPIDVSHNIHNLSTGRKQGKLLPAKGEARYPLFSIACFCYFYYDDI
jgi:hypothetical protein